MAKKKSKAKFKVVKVRVAKAVKVAENLSVVSTDKWVEGPAEELPPVAEPIELVPDAKPETPEHGFWHDFFFGKK